MTRLNRLARMAALAAVGMCAFACAVSVAPSISEAKKAAAAPQKPAAPPQNEAEAKAQEAAAAKQAYDAGLKSYATGKFQPAVEQLTTALKGGGLSSAEMAKALFTRGMSYKKQNKPGLAISDLTSSLWLKNGLSGTDRQTATAERAEAYKAAGIADAGAMPERAVVADPNPTGNAAGLSAAAVAEAAAKGPAAGFDNSAPGSGGTQITRQDANSEAAQDAARARAAQQVTDGGLESSIASSSVVTAGAASPPASAASGFSVAPAAEAASAPAAAPSEAPAGSSSMMSSVTGFFSNMFGVSPAQPAAVTTASTEVPVVQPETSSWSSGTVVTPGAKPIKTKAQTVALATPPPPPMAKVKLTGKYKVHIAAVRSRAEADALAQQLVAQHGADLAGHTPTVDEAVIGSMGTFYRVRVGGYASQDEPRSVCNKLRTSGLDCLVVTN